MAEVKYEHWTDFGGAKSIEARGLNASHLGKEIAIMVGSAAVIGPAAKLTFVSGGGWGAEDQVKVTVGYEDNSFKVKLDGSSQVHLMEVKVHSMEDEVPA